jgi:hypothetical protein
MQFETIVMTGFVLAVLFFLFVRRHIIQDMKRENAVLQTRVDKLNDIAARQRDEMNKLMDTAQAERRARQMATLSSQTAAKVPPARATPVAGQTTAEKQDATTRRRFDQSSSGNTWAPDTTNASAYASASPAPAQEPYRGGGGSFDGGGASGDYGSSSSSCDSSSSSDSGSSSSSDSGGSCGSSD